MQLCDCNDVIFGNVVDNLTSFACSFLKTANVIIVCSSDLEVPFFWVLVKPHCRVFGANSDDTSSIPTERVQDVDSPFFVDPETGILPPLATSTFTVTFAPAAVNA